MARCICRGWRLVCDCMGNCRDVERLKMSDKFVKKVYVPDYNSLCGNCGQSPVVTLEVGGEVETNFELCGPCVFGEAGCIDPEEW